MWRWLWFWRPPCWRRVVLANLVDAPDTAIKGVLWSSWGPWIVMRNAELLRAREAPAAIDGEVVIARANVSFFQVLP